MQIIKSFIRVVFFVCPVAAFSQSTYIPQGSKDIQFIDRLEIKQRTNTDLDFSTLKPYSRKAVIRQAEFLDSARMGYTDSSGIDKYKEWNNLNLSPVDEYNLQSLLMNNSEWVTAPHPEFISKKPILKAFYKTKANLLEYKSNDLFLAINPIIAYEQSKENNNSENLFINTRGITARGLIARRIGFSTTITDNQERGPLFFQSKVNQLRAVPGVGFYKVFKTTGTDYFDGRGYVTFNAAKYIDFQFGYDKNFIGNGYRSLFLSDWGNSYLFLKVNTRIWKFNYENIFMEVMPQFVKTTDTLLDRKYVAMHHLSMNVTKWLNLGVFEGVVFGRKNHFDLQYLNPIIFYRHIEGTVGSPDNAVLGLDFKANAAHQFQFYGQLMLDEFILKEFFKHDGYWANKYGVQLGMKYLDAFGISNLDLQIETNRVRPFTYSHNDSIANYTHYNQPLAHPLGANFQEYIGLLHYQPLAKWNINAKMIYYKQGLDSNGVNFGSNPFENYNTRRSDFGYAVGSGREATCLNASLQVSYELRQNLFIDLSGLYRSYQFKNEGTKQNTTMVSLGFRLNMFKRDYDF